MPEKEAKRSEQKKHSPAHTGGGLDDATTSNIRKITRIEEEQKSHRTFGERLSEAIALFCGSMVFVYVHVAWFAVWIIYNSFLRVKAFDPFPYTFLTMVVSLEAIFLSTFILISQNHDTKLSERRNHLDLQINLLAEQENTRMLELLHAIAKKVGVQADEESVKVLTEETDPEKLVKQIISATGDEPPGDPVISGK